MLKVFILKCGFIFFCNERHYCSIAKMIGNDFLIRHEFRDGCIDRPGAGRTPDGLTRIILRYFLRKRGIVSTARVPREGGADGHVIVKRRTDAIWAPDNSFLIKKG